MSKHSQSSFILTLFLAVSIVFSLESKAMELTIESGQSLVSPDFDGAQKNQFPTDKDIMSLGQMGGNLHPNSSSATAGLGAKQTQFDTEAANDNRLFADAMDHWNVHNYKQAYNLFDEYRSKFPNGKWTGEAILHQGCEARFNGRYREAGDKFDEILYLYSDSGFVGDQFVVDKAKSRLAVLRVMQNSLNEAYRLFTELKADAVDWRQRTYAANWILRISRMRDDQAQLANCGNKALSDILARDGKHEAAKAIEQRNSTNPKGYSLSELRALAEEQGYRAQAVSIPISELENVPLPAIAQIDRSDVNGLGHYWVIESVKDGIVSIYDAQKFRKFEQSLDEFAQEWGGDLLVLDAGDNELVAAYAMADSRADQIFGGCCGVQRPEENLGDPSPCAGGNGCPIWRVNRQNMNVYVTDTPLWYATPYGPDVDIKLSYNSQSAIAGNEVFGNKWLLNYNSYLVVDPGSAVTVFMPDGRRDVYLEDGSGGFQTAEGTYHYLTQIGINHFELRQEDGTTLTYQIPSGTNSQQPFLTQITDVHGQSLTFNFDAMTRLAGIVDAQGRETVITYGTSGHVEKVTDPFGREALFGHNANGALTSITDMGGYVSTLTYDADMYVQSITKPEFGTWSFNFELPDGIDNGADRYPAPGAPMWEAYRVTITDPLMRRTEYHYDGETMSWMLTPDNYIDYVDTLVNNRAQPRAISAFVRSTGGWSRLADLIDEDGNLWQYSYVTSGISAGKKQLERYPNGGSMSFGYNSANQLSRITKANLVGAIRQEFNFEYWDTDSQLISRITQPSVFGTNNIKETLITYDANRYLDTVTTNGFDADGNTVSRQQDVDFNSLGQLVRLDGPRDDIADDITFTYHDCSSLADPSCGQLASVTNALGRTVYFNQYTDGGLPSQMVDANGLVTEYLYDGLDRLTRLRQFHQSDSVNQRDTVITYRGAKRSIASLTYPDGISYSFTYDDAEQLKEVVDSFGNRVAYEYDDDGNREAINRFDDSGTLEQRLETTYDLINNAEQVSTGSSVLQLSIDGEGLLKTLTDPNQNPDTNYTYDKLNRLTSYIDALGNTTRMTYDSADNVTSVEAPNGATTTYRYDDLGNLLNETSPDRGTTDYTHDSAGNIQSMTDARGIMLTYQYDALNRATRDFEDEFSEGGNTRVVYDDCPNGIGRVCKVFDGSGRTELSYDQWGNIVTSDRRYSAFSSAQNYQTSYTYDAGNRIEQITYPSGRTVNYQYDTVGRVTTVLSASVTGGTETLLSNRQLRADGQLKSQTYGNASIETRTYDNQSQIDVISLNGTTLFDYGYDDNGSILQNNGLNNQTFSYDALDRVKTDQSNVGSNSFDYDANGNRSSFTQDGSSLLFNYEIESNRLNAIGGQTQQSDAAGNLLSYQDNKMAYNQYGQLSRLTNNGLTVNYAYDSRWQRTRKKHGSWVSDYHYDLQGRLIAISDSNGNVHTEYVYADAQAVNPFARIRQTNGASNTAESWLENQPAPSNNVSFTCEAPPSPQALFSADTASGAPSDQSSAELPDESINDSPDADQPLVPTPSEIESASSPFDVSHFLPILYYYLLFDEDFTYLEDVLRLDREADITLDADQASLVWDAVPGAEQYVVAMSNNPANLVQGEGPGVDTHCANQNRANVTGLMPNQTQYVRIWALVSGEWQYQDYVINRPNVTTTTPEEVLYLVHDNLGTPRQALDENQNVVWQWNSDAFGQTYPNEDVDNDSQATTINLRFAGQYYDVESELHYNWHRYYSPSMGRYLSSDTLGLLDGPNTFSYGHNNPNSEIDPTGQLGIPGALIGGGIDLAVQLFQNGGRWDCVNWGSVAGSAALGAIGGVGASLGRATMVGAFKHSIKGAKWANSSKRWNSVGSRYRNFHNKNGSAPGKDWQAHHWAFRRGGRDGPTWRNYPLNLNPLLTPVHRRIHGSWQGQRRYNSAQRWWHGTPRWYKQGQLVGGTTGGVAGSYTNKSQTGGCQCNR